MKGKLKQYALMALTSLVLSGCASNYKSFYIPVTGATPEEIAKVRAVPAPTQPLVERMTFTDGKQIQSDYLKRGYIPIGSAMFNSGESESEDDAIEQGRLVGADLVLIFTPKYTGSVTSSVPLTMPTTNTSYSSGSATAYGAGGPVTAYGNSTTTTYGTNTTYIPVTVNRSDYGAAYFIKRRFSLGIFGRSLNDAERQALQTNQGYVVETIVDGSPAYLSDILPGDVIVLMAGEKVSTPEDVSRLIGIHDGQSIKLNIVRKDKSLEKSVALLK
ncbi:MULTISPECIES: PDZ domain-containing protein [Pseudomonas]|uniref:PDZ domain-containing protein n=1 Tax=Pseudomonas TaxID=286 RepID=UPI000CFEE206|nr:MULTISPECIES: PDZ domain-containing protein [Pseudomonas]PRA51950.1 signaling protein [Pseudomonas sp. MYb115]QXN51390.1 PDZ domain-containing protein [Pseudomonas fluorescens]WSO25709.1 PDZ domain-containing protein [Pseudomonas fluorescens]